MIAASLVRFLRKRFVFTLGSADLALLAEGYVAASGDFCGALAALRRQTLGTGNALQLTVFRNGSLVGAGSMRGKLLDEVGLLASHDGQPEAVSGSRFAAEEVATRAREGDGNGPFRQGPARRLGDSSDLILRLHIVSPRDSLPLLYRSFLPSLFLECVAATTAARAACFAKCRCRTQHRAVFSIFPYLPTCQSNHAP